MLYHCILKTKNKNQGKLKNKENKTKQIIDNNRLLYLTKNIYLYYIEIETTFFTRIQDCKSSNACWKTCFSDLIE